MELDAPAADPRAEALKAEHSRRPLSAGLAAQTSPLSLKEPSMRAAADVRSDVMMFLDPAGAGLDRGVDDVCEAGIIPAISDRVVPVDFRRVTSPHGVTTGRAGAAWATSLVVTVQAHLIGGEVQGYVVLQIHDRFPRAGL